MDEIKMEWVSMNTILANEAFFFVFPARRVEGQLFNCILLSGDLLNIIFYILIIMSFGCWITGLKTPKTTTIFEVRGWSEKH